MRRKRIYLESSVISYLAARPSYDIRKLTKQSFTKEWWEGRDKYDLFASTLIRAEIGWGNAEAAFRRLEIIAELPQLETTPKTKEVVDALIDSKAVPGSSRDDAYHIALAAVHGMDYILTWNQSHIANQQQREHIDAVLRRLGLTPPIILTPEQLLEVESCLDRETP